MIKGSISCNCRKGFTKDINPEVVRFKDIIKCLGLKEYVIFISFYEDSHIKPLLQNSIASVHLSLYEGWDGCC